MSPSSPRTMKKKFFHVVAGLVGYFSKELTAPDAEPRERHDDMFKRQQRTNEHP